MSALSRRGFLRVIGLGATATAGGILLPTLVEEPYRRKIWQVSRNAPVRGGRWHSGDIMEVRINGVAYPVKPGANLEFDVTRGGMVFVDDEIDSLEYAHSAAKGELAWVVPKSDPLEDIRAFAEKVSADARLTPMTEHERAEHERMKQLREAMHARFVWAERNGWIGGNG